MPQRLQDAATLLGISAWHLYPDVLILGDKTTIIKQEDRLVSPGGLLTVGLEVPAESFQSVSWSLPLAYLRYYGDPVPSSSYVSTDNSRLSTQQLGVVVLGCVLHSWPSDYSSDPLEGARWVTVVYELIHSTLATHDKLSTWSGAINNSSWLSMLNNAAISLLESSSQKKQTLVRLVNLGRRRAKFISEPTSYPAPLFGLADPELLI
jgi:hypothetical protein